MTNIPSLNQNIITSQTPRLNQKFRQRLKQISRQDLTPTSLFRQPLRQPSRTRSRTRQRTIKRFRIKTPSINFKPTKIQDIPILIFKGEKKKKKKTIKNKIFRNILDRAISESFIERQFIKALPKGLGRLR